MRIQYPFKPKSNRYLIPGQFWAIPLDCGKFACGRVIEIDPNYTKGFLAGLMDWIGDNPPTAEDLKGCKTLKQGSVHIKTIHETGLDGSILGYRPLNLESIESNYFLSQLLIDDSCILMKGYKELRKPTVEEAEVTPLLSSWGYMMIKIYAKELLK